MQQRESYKRYSDEQIDRVNTINIYDLAKQRGYVVRDKNSKIAEIRGQGGLDIDKIRNRWYCHSTKVGGGPIQLLEYMEAYQWIDAVKELLNEDGHYSIYTPSADIKEISKENFKLPEKNNNYRHIFAYLVKTRKIHPAIVNDFVKKKLLYENTKKSCVFVGQDKYGVARYANIRSTNTYGNSFKGEASLSDKRFGFARVGNGQVLTIMEAPIDLLSYMTIYKIHGLEKMIENEHLLSLGGVSDNALKQYLYDHPQITKIKLGLDNDEVGNEACIKIIQDYSNEYKIERIHMKGKDFNDTLIQDINQILLKKTINQMQKLQIEEVHDQNQQLELA